MPAVRAMLEFFEFKDIQMPEWTSMFMGGDMPLTAGDPFRTPG